MNECYSRNCARSGGGILYPSLQRSRYINLTITLESSINYVLDSDDVILTDPHSLLKSFDDTDTLSGNVVLVCYLPPPNLLSLLPVRRLINHVCSVNSAANAEGRPTLSLRREVLCILTGI